MKIDNGKIVEATELELEDCGLYSGNCDTYKQAVTK